MNETTDCIDLGKIHATEAYAVPGEDSLIDCINPHTGLTAICNETLEQVRERYPNAVKINISDWILDKGKRQDSPIDWEIVTEDRYFEMLECLPPAAYGRKVEGFLVGEPWDHHAITGQPRYSAFIKRYGVHYGSTRPLTVREFFNLDVTIPVNL